MFISFFMVYIFLGLGSYFFFYFKVLLVMITFIIIRGVLPRYRYSQLMEICWKFMFPAILGYLYFVAVVFFIFKLSPNIGYDAKILNVINKFLFIDDTKKYLRLEGNKFYETAINFNFFDNIAVKKINTLANGEYKKLFIFFLSSFFFSTLLLAITWILIPKKKSNTKNSSYECGYEPIGAPTAKFEVHFYIVAILFIIFDVEILFLYPWVVGLGRLPFYALFSMTLFLSILIIGYAYEWFKGALNWEFGGASENII